MSVASKKLKTRARIKARIRGKISGTAARPRLTVFRSNKQIYAQVVDDLSGKTLASASSRAIKEAQGVAKIEQAKMVGAKVAEAAKAFEDLGAEVVEAEPPEFDCPIDTYKRIWWTASRDL
ncbi:MAG: 50S ribosomal protein L18, partial [Flavobacteriales bacterium]